MIYPVLSITYGYAEPYYTFVPYMARVSHLPGLGVELDCS